MSNGSKYVTRFNKETAPLSHNGTILAGSIVPEAFKAPFGDAWGYLEGKSTMEGHTHATEEIYIVCGGKGFCHIGEERFAVSVGDVVEVPADTFHTMECEDGETFLWAAFWWNRREE